MKILIVNGPNLNLLGKREPEIYGVQSFEDYLPALRTAFPDVTIDYFQSNHEGHLIDKLQEAGFVYDGIVLNAAGYSHTSIALADTVAFIQAPVIEVHISNVFNREVFRTHSYISAKCAGIIVGLGLTGYKLAIEYFISQRF